MDRLLLLSIRPSISALRGSALLAALLVLAGLPARPAPAARSQVELTEATGVVIGFDRQASLLNVNTRLGPRLFLVTPETLILLNNHEATTNDILPGDEVEVRYRFDTSVAFLVHLFRETRVAGRIVGVTGTTIQFRVHGAVLPLRVNAQSALRLGGVPVQNAQLLVGLRATAVFEPGSFLLLGLAADGRRASGLVKRIDVATGTVVLAGPRGGSFVVSPLAVILRDGRPIPLSELRTTDRLDVVYVRDGTAFRALLLQVRAPAPGAGARAERGFGRN